MFDRMSYRALCHDNVRKMRPNKWGNIACYLIFDHVQNGTYTALFSLSASGKEDKYLYLCTMKAGSFFQRVWRRLKHELNVDVKDHVKFSITRFREEGGESREIFLHNFVRGV